MAHDSRLHLSTVSCRGLSFNCRHAGLDNRGDAVLFLHGFPQNSALWTELMQALAALGYRCLAPDQRGYSQGARPSERQAYQLAELMADPLALADHFKMSRFHLIGHDWGAFIGWKLVEAYPERIQSWTALSIPHLRSFLGALKNDPEQKKQSSYMRLFRLPWLPEILFTKNKAKLLKAMWAKIPSQRVDDYLQSVGSYRGMKAALDWYRANPLSAIDLAPIHTPTLFIAGKKDQAVSRAAVEGAGAFMQGPYQVIVSPKGHWLVEEDYQTVEEAIKSHLQRFAMQV